jgi:hypothetical protein
MKLSRNIGGNDYSFPVIELNLESYFIGHLDIMPGNKPKNSYSGRK